MKLRLAWCGLVAVLGASLAVPPSAAQAQARSRGALLYDTHCIACHTEQVHWRQRGLVTDWVSLRAQVWRWQADSALGWSDEDVAEVARYLNGEFYHFPGATGAAGRAGYASEWQATSPRRQPVAGQRRP